jgi:hypothetical protein
MQRRQLPKDQAHTPLVEELSGSYRELSGWARPIVRNHPTRNGSARQRQEGTDEHDQSERKYESLPDHPFNGSAFRRIEAGRDLQACEFDLLRT